MPITRSAKKRRRSKTRSEESVVEIGGLADLHLYKHLPGELEGSLQYDETGTALKASSLNSRKSVLQDHKDGINIGAFYSSDKKLTLSRKIPSPEKSLKKEFQSTDTSSEEDENEDSDEILSYEMKREENIRANAEFFAQLGILEAKHELKKSAGKPKNIRRTSKIKFSKEKEPAGPRRVSLRIRSAPPVKYLPPPVEYPVYDHLRPPAGPVPMTEFLGMVDTEDLHHELEAKIQTASKKKTKAKPENFSLTSFMQEFKEMKITAATFTKVVKDRIFSVAVHPTEEMVLAAAGDKWGKIGFWDVLSEGRQDGVVVYEPHSKPVNSLEFSRVNHSKVFSCSYDGSFRCGDFEKGEFYELYSVPIEEDILLRNFDFQSEHAFIVAQSDGCVAVVDQRTNGTSAEGLFKVHQKPLRAVSVHPIEKHYFVTGGIDAKVCVWDLRKMKAAKNTPLSVGHHAKSVDSACFSPVTGNHILTCSSDDTMCVYNWSSSSSKNLILNRNIRHNNFTGRWLTKFRAAWHPSRDDVFVVGSMSRPRRIEIFSSEGQLLHAFQNEDWLTSVCSVSAIHPSRNVLVGGNSSGRLFVFM